MTDKINFVQMKASVSWLGPVPTCPVTPVDEDNPEANSGEFPVGKHKLVYKYRHSPEFQTFYIQCDVNIVVAGRSIATV